MGGNPIRRFPFFGPPRPALAQRPHPTHRPNELWQTDFTYLHVGGWGWYYLSTVLDDYSRFILAWLLRPTMLASDVMEMLDLARAATGVDRVHVAHRPRLLSDNGPGDLSHQLATYLDTHGLPHTRSAPYHPMTQGKIERYHRSLKNVARTHLSLGKDAPEPRSVRPPSQGRVVEVPYVGGLHHEYLRRAA